MVQKEHLTLSRKNLAMLAVTFVLVYAGYLMERRRQTHKQ